MPYVIYTQDSSISSFFAKAGASSSRTQCDEFVSRRYGGQIQPVDIQGLGSYTVIAGHDGTKTIQFREKTAMLDANMLALIRGIHKDTVPNCSELGRIGNPEDAQLVIYEMDRIHGENLIITRPSFTHDKLLNTVNSLAKFFAQSWQSTAQVGLSSADKSALNAECYARFGYLANTLPERFQPLVREAEATLPELLDGNYPTVLTHGDLNEMNILVNPGTGEITGVVDWSEASIQPFGFALYALENVLGGMGQDGWKWSSTADDLRETFWRAFQQQTGVSERQTRLIRAAGKAGILIRYGTAYDSGFPGMIGVRDPKMEEFRYLDALLL